MAFDKEILREINKDFAARRIARESEAEARLAQVYEAIPRIREIDAELRLTPVEIVRAAFAKRENAAPKLAEVREKNLKLQAQRAELLVEGGFSWDYLDVKYDCKKCEDKGYIDPGKPCECLINAYRKAQIKELKKLLPYADSSFESFDFSRYSQEKGANPYSQYDSIKINFDVCQKYAEQFDQNSGNLFFTGASGAGKTYLASCVALEVAARGFSVLYGTAFDILGAFEDKKFNREVDEDKTEIYKTVDLLIIDDVGAEMITPFSVAALYNLMVNRENAGKSTIIVSTLSVKEIRKRYTEQIASRLESKYVSVSMVGQDIHRKVGK